MMIWSTARLWAPTKSRQRGQQPLWTGTNGAAPKRDRRRDAHQGAGCTRLGSNTWRSWREATAPVRACCARILNTGCLSVHQQGGPQEAGYKSQLILSQSKLAASTDFQGTCTLCSGSLCWDRGETVPYAALDRSKMIKIQVPQAQQSSQRLLTQRQLLKDSRCEQILLLFCCKISH